MAKKMFFLVMMCLMTAGLVNLNSQESMKPMNEWYFADMMRSSTDFTPDKAVHGMQGPTLEWILIFNMSNKEADLDIRYYFENEKPYDFKMKVKPAGRASVGGHLKELSEKFPINKLYSVKIKSSVPIMAQATRAEQEFGVVPPLPKDIQTAEIERIEKEIGKKPTVGMPGRSFLSRLAYPGPLGKKETAWTYVDCFIGRDNPRVEETEWLTVLNPNAGKPAKIKVTFNQPDNTRKVYEFTVEAERVKTIALEHVQEVQSHAINGVVVQSDVPIVVDQVRRYWYRAQPAPAGTWIVTGFPVGDRDLKDVTVK